MLGPDIPPFCMSDYTPLCLVLAFILLLSATGQPQHADCQVLQAARVFDGTEFHTDKVVWIEGDRIKAFAPEPELKIPRKCVVHRFPQSTLMPGMIEGHAHLLLHPYNETSWDNQVMKGGMVYGN